MMLHWFIHKEFIHPMKSTTITRFAGTSALSVVVTGTMLVGTALACHPNGVITKGVTNLTTGGSAVMAADTSGAAVAAKPGDTLKYTIVISNNAPSAISDDDIISAQLTDSLPAGVTLVSGKTSEAIGTVKAKGSVTRTITVKVNANVANGSVLDNKACFTGDATNKAASLHQAGCDHAFVKVTVPQTTPTPTPKPTATPKPTSTPSPEVLGTSTGEGAVTTLPETGAANLLGSAVGLGAMTTAGAAYIRSRRNKR
jgi:uncharacterized repeat protein (TIGR01451 family)/LPXTG-motif cell wall-anchored protein